MHLASVSTPSLLSRQLQQCFCCNAKMRWLWPANAPRKATLTQMANSSFSLLSPVPLSSSFRTRRRDNVQCCSTSEPLSFPALLLISKSFLGHRCASSHTFTKERVAITRDGCLKLHCEVMGMTYGSNDNSWSSCDNQCSFGGPLAVTLEVCNHRPGTAVTVL